MWWNGGVVVDMWLEISGECDYVRFWCGRPKERSVFLF